MKKFKIVLCILFALIFIVGAGFCFYYGFILNKASKPNEVFYKVIDGIDSFAFDLINLNDKYDLGDNFEFEGTTSFDFDTTYMSNEIKIDPNLIGKYNTYNNLKNSKTSYKYMQNKDLGKLYSEIDQYIGTEEVLLRKKYVENTTDYVYIKSIGDKYINNGSNIYFENYLDDVTTKDNILYLHDFIRESLKNNLLESDFEKKIVDVNLEDETKSLYQMSIKFDNKKVITLFRSILKDLKNDTRSNNILMGIDNNFSNYKIDDLDKYLEKNEIIIFYIYTDKVFFNPVKYEVVHIKGDEKKLFNYEINKRGYYALNDVVKYSCDVNIKDKDIELIIYDNKNNKVGKFNLDKDYDDISLDYNLNIDEKNVIELSFSSKMDNVKSKKSFDNTINYKYKKIEDGNVVFNSSIINTLKFNKNSTIKIDTNDVIIRSALSDEQEVIFNDLYSSVKERFEK